MAKVDARAHKVLYAQYRHNAERKQISFSLSFDEAYALFRSKCHYCNAGPSRRKNCGGSFHANGIDRVDNRKGYDSANVVAACATCNYAKRFLTRKEFTTWARRLALHQRVDL